MKKTFFFLIAILPLSAMRITAPKKAVGIQTSPSTINPPKNKGFALVELFTSEGCSSCPPAESVMHALQNLYKNENVFFLEYHVDYWDRLGWKDQFSEPSFTQRQNRYAALLNLESVYTPQAVVNGTAESVGSDQPKVKGLIEKNISANSHNLQMDFTVDKSKMDKITVSFPGKLNLQPYEVIEIALVLNKTEVQIRRGENAGLHIAHFNTVLKMQELNGKEKISFQAEEKYSHEDLSVIVFVQNTKTGNISFCK